MSTYRIPSRFSSPLPLAATLATLLLFPFHAACGGGGGTGGGHGSTGSGGAGGHPTSMPDGSAPDGSTPVTYPDKAQTTATTDPSCNMIAPFYWEIGDAAGAMPLAGGAVPGADGGAPYQRNTVVEIASASKWFFGAYVVQTNQGLLSQPANHTAPSDPGLVTAFEALTMRAGYNDFDDDKCALALNQTVDGCFVAGNSSMPGAGPFGFHYSGGQFQWYADKVLGWGSYGDTDLADKYQAALGQDLPIVFKFPELAGGMLLSAAGYAAFLQKILAGELAISGYLAYDPVCTLPGTCPAPDATYSPAAPHAWHYSWGHWIEDGSGDDGAFASPGKFGFYPWIDATIKYYGVVAREDHSLDPANPPYLQSVYCGQDIRKAFFTGKVYAHGAPVP